MKCQTCNLGPEDGVTVYRQNEVGELPAVWACREHRTAPVPDDVQALVDVIEREES